MKRRFTMKKFMRYLHTTRKNKLVALALVACGIISAIVSGDFTALVFFIIVSVPMFFAKENWIY